MQSVAASLLEADAYFPAAQSKHAVTDVAPSCVEYFPATHSSQELAPKVGENFPLGQSPHALSAAPPVLGRNLPVLHSVHSASKPNLAEYFPSSHARQSVSTLLPSVRSFLPAAQSVQLSGPRTALYVPATQILQDPPEGPVNPALHRHADFAVLPAGEMELSGHERQAVTES